MVFLTDLNTEVDMQKLTPSELKKVQQKIVKLLALSASPNEAEAALAMSKCKELMDKYGITSIDVDPVRKTVDTDSRFVKAHGDRKRIPQWMGMLSGGLCDIFSCLGVSHADVGHWVGLTFVGGASDVAIVSDLYVRLKRIIGGMGRNYIENTPYKSTSKSRETYCMGVVVTVLDRIRTAYCPMSNALVLVKEKEVEKHFNEMFPKKLKTAKFKSEVKENTDIVAFTQGLEDGKNVNIARAIND